MNLFDLNSLPLIVGKGPFKETITPNQLPGEKDLGGAASGAGFEMVLKQCVGDEDRGQIKALLAWLHTRLKALLSLSGKGQGPLLSESQQGSLERLVERLQELLEGSSVDSENTFLLSTKSGDVGSQNTTNSKKWDGRPGDKDVEDGPQRPIGMLVASVDGLNESGTATNGPLRLADGGKRSPLVRPGDDVVETSEAHGGVGRGGLSVLSDGDSAPYLGMGLQGGSLLPGPSKDSPTNLSPALKALPPQGAHGLEAILPRVHENPGPWRIQFPSSTPASDVLGAFPNNGHAAVEAVEKGGLVQAAMEMIRHGVDAQSMSPRSEDPQGLLQVLLRAMVMASGDEEAAVEGLRRLGARRGFLADSSLVEAKPQAQQGTEAAATVDVLAGHSPTVSILTGGNGTKSWGKAALTHSEGTEMKGFDPFNGPRNMGVKSVAQAPSPIDESAPNGEIESPTQKGAEFPGVGGGKLEDAGIGSAVGGGAGVDHSKTYTLGTDKGAHSMNADENGLLGVITRNDQVSRPHSMSTDGIGVGAPVHLSKETGEEIVNHVARSVYHAIRDGEHVVKMRLHPPELGRIRVELRVDPGDSVVRATFLADVKEIKGLLEQHHYLLKETLMQHGYQLHDFSVHSMSPEAELDSGLGWSGGGTGTGHETGANNARGNGPWNEGTFAAKSSQDSGRGQATQGPSGQWGGGLSIRV